MCEGSEQKSKELRPFVLLGIAFVVVLAVWLLTPSIVEMWAPSPGSDLRTGVSTFADQFAVTSGLFTALALAALVVTIYQQQKGLAQQREDLTLQRKELGLQRKELERSVTEMEKSAKAQTAQVRVNTLSALLASLPVLIRDEENRVRKLAGGFSGCGLQADLESHTAEGLELKLGEIGGKGEELRKRAEKQSKTFAGIEGSPRGEREKGKLDRTAEDIENNRCLVTAVNRLIALHRELDATYGQMKGFRDWEGAGSKDSEPTV